jgi:NADH-quinone oxidoreductase subunit E
MDIARVDAIMSKYGNDPDFLIEMLQDVQDAWRHLPKDVMKHMADSLKVPLARLGHIATFYGAFSLEPRGVHQLQVCMGTACHVKGAPRVLDAMSRSLGVGPGETTNDRQYTLEAVRCVGACGLAPVVSIDAEYYGDLTPDSATTLITKHRKEGGR